MSVTAHAQTALDGGPRFEGRPVRFGGTEWVVPALTLGPIRRLAPVLDRITRTDVSGAGATGSTEQLDALLQVVHAALVRNYPALTVDELADLLELPALTALVQAVMEISGFLKAAEGAAGNGDAGQG